MPWSSPRAWREALNARDLALMLTLVNDRLEVLTPRGTKRGLRSVRESMARQTGDASQQTRRRQSAEHA